MAQLFTYVKIEIFIPEEYVEALRDGLHTVNVGWIGNYDHCLSVSDVRGYWRPLEGATPHEGKVGEISCGHECKVEVSCLWEAVPAAIQVIRRIHPYEKPLINVLPLLNHEFDGLEL